MLSLEQVIQLESKVTRIIEHVKKVNGENSSLKKNLDSYKKRIQELELIIQQFKEDQDRIEDGILSALDRLNKFEDAVESVLSSESASSVETTLASGNAPASEQPKQNITVQTPSDLSEKPVAGKELDIF